MGQGDPEVIYVSNKHHPYHRSIGRSLPRSSPANSTISREKRFQDLFDRTLERMTTSQMNGGKKGMSVRSPSPGYSSQGETDELRSVSDISPPP